VPTDPLKLAQYRKVELMKMRHRAAAGDSRINSSSSVPIDQRIHLKILVDDIEKVFWFHKVCKYITLLQANADMGISQWSLARCSTLSLAR